MRVVLSTLLTRVRPRALDPASEPMRTRAVTLTPAQGALLALDA
jgi:hypothetical protein